MPMFGSTLGGRSGASGTYDQTGKSALKGARLRRVQIKELWALIPITAILHQEGHSPIKACRVCRIPEIILQVQVTPLLGNGTELPVLLPYAWNEQFITDTLNPSIDGISQVIVLNPIKCFVFKGCQSQGMGISLEEATGFAQQLHRSYHHWIG